MLFRTRANHGLGFTRPTLLLKQLQLVKLQLVKHSQEGPEGQLHKLYLHRLDRELKFTRGWKPSPNLEVAESKLSFELKLAGQTDRLGLVTIGTPGICRQALDGSASRLAWPTTTIERLNSIQWPCLNKEAGLVGGTTSTPATSNGRT